MVESGFPARRLGQQHTKRDRGAMSMREGRAPWVARLKVAESQGTDFGI